MAKYKIKYVSNVVTVYEAEIESENADWACEDFYDKVVSGEIKPITSKNIDANWEVKEIK
jgi:hypothetical protein